MKILNDQVIPLKDFFLSLTGGTDMVQGNDAMVNGGQIIKHWLKKHDTF